MNAQARLETLIVRPEVVAATAFVRDSDEETLRTQVELSEIAAPPFGEEARAARVQEMFVAAGLTKVHRDGVGNVIASPALAAPMLENELSPLVVSAHMDTVFPAGLDVSVTRTGDLLQGPGISDDARGLTTLLTLARTFGTHALRTETPVLFVATVGEEGAGDLRGVKHLFAGGGAASKAAAFISLDGAGLERIVVNGLGSRRYRVTVSGAGGHSWVDWGTPNPIHTLMELGDRLTAIELPHEPQTTLTIARVSGGKSINAIPQEAWLEIDTRSASNENVDGIEAEVRDCVDRTRHRHPALAFEITLIGDRPGGSTSPDDALVASALAATRHQQREPILALSSTDSNIPMALGVSALTMGCGGDAGLAHTTKEWYRNVDGPEGVIRALHTVLLYARLV